jgi:hypothetical protein
MEVDETVVEGDTTPFLREYTVMMTSGRHPSLEKSRMLDPSMGTPLAMARDGGTRKCKGPNFLVH